ncbi:MAG: ribosomal protein S18-alanine N-acetyltransferase [Candidatus Delongbacteria bacterium]|nr:ribosomal protein S18-alanine N-acetyltransferase [bacterium]MBL7034059.1 ribosomal protein S18-alanine N-acetyltransferase [Candidatus Delongbacteria bacterium]
MTAVETCRLVPEQILVRPAGNADLLSIVAIEACSFEDPWPATDFNRLQRSPFCEILVAESTGDGICGFSVSRYYAGVGELLNLAVLPGTRRQGCGKLLVETVKSRSVIHSCEQLSLEVRHSNRAAIALYAKSGFKATEVIKEYYADGEAALVMVLKLPEKMETDHESP